MDKVGKNNLKVGKNNLLNRAEYCIFQAIIRKNYSEAYFNQLVKITQLNRSTILAELNKLVKQEILEKSKKGNAVYYKITRNQQSIAILSYVEYCRTNAFLKQNNRINNSLKLFAELEAKTISCLIFGSHAKGYAKKTSDVDVLFIGNYEKQDIKKSEDISRKAYARTGVHISAVLIDIKDLAMNRFLQEARKNHFIVYGAEFILRYFV